MSIHTYYLRSLLYNQVLFGEVLLAESALGLRLEDGSIITGFSADVDYSFNDEGTSYPYGSRGDIFFFDDISQNE